MKTNKIDRSLQLTIQKNRLQFDIVHAHSLFINGKVALLQKNSSGAKYIVAVRSTDVDVFFRYFFWLRRTGLKILMQAEIIIFISPHLQNKLLSYVKSKEIANLIKSKSLIIPNGIDDYWHQQIHLRPIKDKSNSLLFVGKFLYRKNLHKLLIELFLLRLKGRRLNLTVVGDGNSVYSKMIKWVCQKLKFINYVEKWRTSEL